MLTTTPTCSKRSTNSRSDQFPARKSLPTSRARSSRSVAPMNLSTLFTIPMRTTSTGGVFGSHFSSRTPGGIGGGVPAALNNPINSSPVLFEFGDQPNSRVGQDVLNSLAAQCEGPTGVLGRPRGLPARSYFTSNHGCFYRCVRCVQCVHHASLGTFERWHGLDGPSERLVEASECARKLVGFAAMSDTPDA